MNKWYLSKWGGRTPELVDLNQYKEIRVQHPGYQQDLTRFAIVGLPRIPNDPRQPQIVHILKDRMTEDEAEAELLKITEIVGAIR